MQNQSYLVRAESLFSTREKLRSREKYFFFYANAMLVINSLSDFYGVYEVGG